jgi:hypothetical protein
MLSEGNAIGEVTLSAERKTSGHLTGMSEETANGARANVARSEVFKTFAPRGVLYSAS